MKWIIVGASLFVAMAAVMLAQVWFAAMDNAVFLKVELTLAVLLVVEATLWFIFRELRAYRRQTRSSALDGDD